MCFKYILIWFKSAYPLHCISQGEDEMVQNFGKFKSQYAKVTVVTSICNAYNPLLLAE